MSAPTLHDVLRDHRTNGNAEDLRGTSTSFQVLSLAEAVSRLRPTMPVDEALALAWDYSDRVAQ